MDSLAWKLRVSMLWVFLGAGTLGMFVAVLLPASVLADYIATGQFEGETIDATMLALMVGLFCLLPLAMAFLTLALPDRVNRYANGVLGVVAAVMWAWDLAEHASKGLEIGAVITVALIGAALLIVWHAWKWPKPAEQEVPDRRPVSNPQNRAAGTV
jgi:hypothetical protein